MKLMVDVKATALPPNFSVLIPFIVPTVLSALAFWWIFDSQFSIISWSLKQIGLITENINFLGDVTWARICVIFANIWRGVPFVAVTLLAGLQTVARDDLAQRRQSVVNHGQHAPSARRA